MCVGHIQCVLHNIITQDILTLQVTMMLLDLSTRYMIPYINYIIILYIRHISLKGYMSLILTKNS